MARRLAPLTASTPNSTSTPIVRDPTTLRLTPLAHGNSFHTDRGNPTSPAGFDPGNLRVLTAINKPRGRK